MITKAEFSRARAAALNQVQLAGITFLGATACLLFAAFPKEVNPLLRPLPVRIGLIVAGLGLIILAARFVFRSSKNRALLRCPSCKNFPSDSDYVLQTGKCSTCQTQIIMDSTAFSHVQPERPFPPLTTRQAAIFIGPFLAISALVIWFASRSDNGLSMLLAFVVIGVTVFVCWHLYLRRCPQCHGMLVARRRHIEGTKYSYRLLMDCPRCQISWDTQQNFGRR
jgi:hypothetical protein